MKSNQILGYRNQIVGLIRRDRTGAEITVPLATAEALVKICDELARIEKNHGE